MRWLLLKDLQILRRSPLLVALLVIYPIAIAVLIGIALSRAPDKPKVAFLNQVPASANEIEIGSRRIDASKQANPLFEAIDPVRVNSRREVIDKVRSGDVVGGLILPPDLTQKIQSGVEPAEIEVFYNAEDPAKREYVENTIKSQVQDANAALTGQLAKVAVEYLDLLATGGEFDFLGQHLDVLGLEKSQAVLEGLKRELPRDRGAQARLDEVIEFSRLAQDNISLGDDILAAVGDPIRVNQHVLKGSSQSLSSFAVAIAVTVSLMFVTLLLAAGTLALEREENAFLRLVRGLVSRTGLLVEKATLAAICSFVVTLVMLSGLALFVDLAWDRFPLWLAALAAGAFGFAAMGVALGAITREVRAASLLAFMLGLPIAFLALVPSGSVSAPLYDVIRVVSALFPFKPTLDAMNAALNDSGGLLVPVLHLLALFAGFGLVGRLALARFA